MLSHYSCSSFCLSCVLLVCYLSHRIVAFPWVWGREPRWGSAPGRQVQAWMCQPSCESTNVCNQDWHPVWLMEFGLFTAPQASSSPCQCLGEWETENGAWDESLGSLLGFWPVWVIVFHGRPQVDHMWSKVVTGKVSLAFSLPGLPSSG